LLAAGSKTVNNTTKEGVFRLKLSKTSLPDRIFLEIKIPDPADLTQPIMHIWQVFRVLRDTAAPTLEPIEVLNSGNHRLHRRLSAPADIKVTGTLVKLHLDVTFLDVTNHVAKVSSSLRNHLADRDRKCNTFIFEHTESGEMGKDGKTLAN